MIQTSTHAVKQLRQQNRKRVDNRIYIRQLQNNPFQKAFERHYSALLIQGKRSEKETYASDFPRELESRLNSRRLAQRRLRSCD